MEKGVSMLERLRESTSNLIDHLASYLVKIGFSANSVTLLGLIFSFIAFYELYNRSGVYGGIFIMIAGFFDALDGAVARKTGRAGPIGSFMDSVIDRIEDGLLMLGMGLYSQDLLLAAFSIHSSMLVSYVRAKAESLRVGGTEYSLTGRAERIILASIFCLLGYVRFGLLVITILSYITAFERIFIFLKKSKE